MTLTTFTAAAAGGGGGGGGGGATRKVSNWALGNSSVKANGIASIMPIAKTFKMNDVVVAKALRLLWTPNSSTLSANMALGGTGGPSTSSLRAGTDAAARVGA